VTDADRNVRIVEALLFASAAPVDRDALAKRLPDDADIDRLIAEVAERYAGRGVNLVTVAGGWAFRTAPDIAPHLRSGETVERRPSRAALETLAIIAYHQPVTRAEIEQIRGVAVSKGTLDILFEAGWVQPRGRRRTPGKPVTWTTTPAFLDHFGLAGRHDLPGPEELKAAGRLEPGPEVWQMGEGEEEGGNASDEPD